MITCYNIPLRINSPQASTKKDHWGKRLRAKKLMQMAVKRYMAACLAKPPCKVTLTRIAPRMLDEHDNLRTAMKPIVDIIADVLIPGLKMGRADDSKEITWEYAQEKGKVREYFLRVQIEHNLP